MTQQKKVLWKVKNTRENLYLKKRADKAFRRSQLVKTFVLEPKRMLHGIFSPQRSQIKLLSWSLKLGYEVQWSRGASKAFWAKPAALEVSNKSHPRTLRMSLTECHWLRYQKLHSLMVTSCVSLGQSGLRPERLVFSCYQYEVGLVPQHCLFLPSSKS